MSDDKFRRIDIISDYLRDLSKELDGLDPSFTRVGQAIFRATYKHPVKGKYWDALEFTVRDDRGDQWSFTVAVSPAGRSVRIIDGRDSEGRIHHGGRA